MVEVEFSEFQKLDIRVGKVISAERVAGATKLLRFTVDFGEFKRQSVAGLGHIYDPEHFILAAVPSEEEVVPIRPEKDVPVGSKVL